MLRIPDHQEEKQASRAEGDGDHGCDPQDVQHARQRPSRGACLREEHRGSHGEQYEHGALPDPFLCRREPSRDKPAIDPQVLVGDGSGEDVRQEDQDAADAQREEPIHAGGERSRLFIERNWQIDLRCAGGGVVLDAAIAPRPAGTPASTKPEDTAGRGLLGEVPLSLPQRSN